MRRPNRRTLLALLALALVAGLWFAPLGGVEASGALSLSPQPATVYGGEQLTLQVHIDETPLLYGAQLSLTYDNTLLDVVNVRAGTIWPTSGTYSEYSYTQAGTAAEGIRFHVTLVGGASLTAPNGSLLTVVFQAREPSQAESAVLSMGTSPPLLLSDAEAQPTPSTAPAPVSVTVLPSATVSGSVVLQAPAADRPISLALTKDGAQYERTASSGGSFAVLAPAAEGYTLTARARCHLGAQKAPVASPSAGHSVILLAGDVNGDSAIDIVDITMVGARFGRSGLSGCVNANGDAAGIVNILDVVLIARNLALSAPQPWAGP